MSEEVFEDTPFAGYLENIGAEDWGIEDPDENGSETVPEPGIPAQRPVTTHATELRPLRLSENTSHTRKERFRSMIRAALSQRLSVQETSEFLEQFRYAAMSSDLLRELPLYTSWSAGTDERRRALLFDPRKPWTILRISKAQWLGGGGCVVAISALLHWRSRTASLNEKEQIALVLGMLVVLYLFATARKRLLRSLQSKALIFMEHFVTTAKQFDGDVVRALRALQELEVVAAGFAPYGKPPAHFRTSIMLGNKLRTVLSSSLHIITETYVDAVKDCAAMGSLTEIKQFFEMFGVPEQQAELGFEFNSTAVGFKQPSSAINMGIAQVSDLKQALRRAHLARRVFLCCTLAVPATGECQPAELETWTVLTDHLLNCGQLAQQLSNVITKERLSPATAETEVTAQQRKAPPPMALIDLAATVRHLNARLELLQSASLANDEIESHEHAIGLEVADINEQWQRLRIRKARAQQNQMPSSPVPSSPTVIATPQADESSTFSNFTLPDLTDAATETTTDDSVQPTVWEGVVPAELAPQRSSLSRDERIRLMQEARKDTTAQKPASFLDHRSSLASELNNVFRHRPHGSRE